MKHLEVRQKYSAFSSGDETLRLILDILREAPSMKDWIFPKLKWKVNIEP